MKKHLPLGLFLKERRVALKLSQREIAEALNYSSSQFVSNWERALCSPPMEKINVLSDIYKLPKLTLVDLMVADFRERLLRKIKK